MTATQAPNHHAHYPPFRGTKGAIAAISMVFGRDTCTDLAIRLAEPRPTDRLVDVGCGPGTGARTLAKQVAHVTAADPAPVMLRVARLIPSPRNMTWVRASASDLAIDSASVNVVTALATVHHWSELDASCCEIRRILAPGGRFVAIERRIASTSAEGLASHGWTPEQGEWFAEVCLTAGFAHATASVEHEDGNEYVAVIARVD